MRSLSGTLQRLAKLRTPSTKAPRVSPLTPLEPRGSNPALCLGGVTFPRSGRTAPRSSPCCTAARRRPPGMTLGRDGRNWPTNMGFVVLYPEHVQANNADRCSNWFNPDDIKRGHGEALSIRQMIAAMVPAHSIEEKRIYVTGLSAGGAMANGMLATHPEVFAGGAIVAGLPHAVASTMPEAFDRMRAAMGLPTTRSCRQRSENLPAIGEHGRRFLSGKAQATTRWFWRMRMRSSNNGAASTAFQVCRRHREKSAGMCARSGATTPAATPLNSTKSKEVAHGTTPLALTHSGLAGVDPSCSM